MLKDTGRGLSPYSKADSGSCSYVIGWDWGFADAGTPILVIVNRHHWCAKHGMYLLTIGYCGVSRNEHAICDDYGNLHVIGRDD